MERKVGGGRRIFNKRYLQWLFIGLLATILMLININKPIIALAETLPVVYEYENYNQYPEMIIYPITGSNSTGWLVGRYATGTGIYTRYVGAYAKVTTSVSQFTLYYQKYPGYGYIDIYIDDTKITTIYAGDVSGAVATTYSYTLQNPGIHTVKVIVSKAGTYDSAIALDKISITPASLSAPATPNSLTATAIGPMQVTLTWQPNTESDLAGYIIYRDYVEIARVGANATSYIDSNVQPNTIYTYAIKAYNTSNVESDMSNAATVTTPPPPTPATPNSLIATVTGPTQVTLTWQPNTDPYLAGYIIYRDYIEIARVGAGETSYFDTDLSPNSTYIYGIRAYNIWDVASDMSNAATVTTPQFIVSTPRGLTATAISYNQVRLTWQPNTDPGLAGYIIYRDYVEIARVGPSEASYLDNGVQPNTTYIYGIRAYDSSNNVSDISNAATITTPPEIAAPTGLKATASFDHVQLSWNPNTEPTLAGYIIYRDYIEIARLGAEETSYVDNNINPNTRYIYGIKAYSTSGFISDISNAATVTTPASPKPVLTVRVDGKTIKISWTSSGSGYTYKVLVNDQEVTSTSTTSCNYTASTPGYYTVQVVAIAPSGEQYPSDKVGVTISSITTPGASQMVTDLISNIGMLMVPTGGLLALYFGLKASPFLIEAIKAFIVRRL